MSLGFVGDISFNQNREISFDDKILCELSQIDFVIGNLEALVVSSQVNERKKPRLSIEEESLNQLKFLNVKLVTLAHNHVFDNGLEGYLNTVKKLSSLKISFIGAGLSEKEASAPYKKKIGGTLYKFFNYCHSDTHPSLPEACPVFINSYSKQKILNDIIQAKAENAMVILIFHWGGNFEKGYFPSTYQIEDSESFIEAGADLIIGHHSHTVQPCLWMNKKPVFFSLGNFIFSDVHFEGEVFKLAPRSKKGILAKVSFDAPNINTEIVNTVFSDSHLSASHRSLGLGIRTSIFKALGRTKLFSMIYRLGFKYILPLYYFLFYKEGGVRKFKNLNLNKVKRYLWKKS